MKAYSDLHERGQSIKDAKERTDFLNDNDPGEPYMELLLSFEEQRRGEDVGLMALRRIILLAAGGGATGNPRDRGRLT